MKFLFVWPSPGVLGGVETLLVRMSRWLVDSGHEVSILTQYGDNWAGALPARVKCIVLKEEFPQLYYYFHAKRVWQTLGLARPDVIKGFDLGSDWIACQLGAIVGNGCKVLCGMYGCFFFSWYYSQEALPPWSGGRLYLHQYLRNVPENARVFCGISEVEELQQVHRQGSILWPTPIDTAAFRPAQRKPKWGKIVSVGRMDVMKQYNLFMVEVTKKLRQKGYDVTWTVYGTGDHEGRVRKRVQDAALEGVISLEGSVPYSQFWEVLSDAYVFVGMGTAILEAALFGVPNVMALAYDPEGITYGPSYKCPPGSMSPSLVTPPKSRVVDEIERVLQLGPKEYEEEQARVRKHVQPHNIDDSMEHFLRLVHEAQPIRHNKLLYWSNYLRHLVDKPISRIRPHPPRGHPEKLVFANGRGIGGKLLPLGV